MNYLDFINWPSINESWVLPLALVIGVWELVWKAWAMWRAARNKQSGWFIALLIFNTIGILPILYIYVFSPKQDSSHSDKA